MTVYFARVGSDGPIKIGRTTLPAGDRIVGLQVGCPWAIEVIGEAAGDAWHEDILHKALAEYRMIGEWFIPSARVIEVMRLVIDCRFCWPERIAREPQPAKTDPRRIVVRRFIKTLGGGKAVAALTFCKRSAVVNWKIKFPARTYVIMSGALRKKDIEPNPSLWGMIPPIGAEWMPIETKSAARGGDLLGLTRKTINSAFGGARGGTSSKHAVLRSSAGEVEPH